MYFKIKRDFKAGAVLLNRGMFLESPRAKGVSDVMRKQPFCEGPLIRGEITTRVTVDLIINLAGLDCSVMHIHVFSIDLT